MGKVVNFPTPEARVLERLEALCEAAQAGALDAIAIVFRDQDGEYTYDWAGDIDQGKMVGALKDLAVALVESKP